MAWFLLIFVVMTTGGGNSSPQLWSADTDQTQTRSLGVSNYSVVETLPSRVNTARTSELIVWITYANLSLGKKQLRNSGAGLEWLNRTFFVLEEMQQLVEVDIVQLLDNANNKDAILRSHQQQLKDMVRQSQREISYLEWIVQLANEERNTCASQKNAADGEFSTAIAQRFGSMVENSLQDSLSAWVCETRARITVNAHTVIIQQFVQFQELTVTKEAIIANNYQLIVDNYSVMRGELLDQITLLRRQIRSLQR